MTFKDYLTQLANDDVTDDFGNYDYSVIFARDVLREAHDEELSSKENFFRHLNNMKDIETWFIELARAIYQDFEKQASNYH